VKKPRKKVTIPVAKFAPDAMNIQPTLKAAATEQGFTHREHRLMVKRNSSHLTTCLIAIRYSINTTLNATLIQQVKCNPVNHLMFTTKDKVKAILLNSCIPLFLHLIPGVTTVYLNSPSAQLLVYEMPTSDTFVDIGRELSTFNTGLFLPQQARWLTSDKKHANKKAFTIVVTATSHKAQCISQESPLFAFSTTYRLERHISCNEFT
jgi:hypothetical protein